MKLIMIEFALMLKIDLNVKLKIITSIYKITYKFDKSVLWLGAKQQHVQSFSLWYASIDFFVLFIWMDLQWYNWLYAICI